MKHKQQQKKKRERTPYHQTPSGLGKKQKRQLGGSLNRYGFTYARR